MSGQLQPDPLLSEKLKGRYWIFRIIFLVLGILAVLFVSLLLIGYFFEAENDPKSTTEGRYFTSNLTNLSFKIPDGWGETTLSESELPSVFNEPQALFRKDGSSCVIAIVPLTREMYAEFEQISFADRVFSDLWQFDGNWYLPKSADSNMYTFSSHERQYLPGEVRISDIFRRDDAFILFNADGTSVPDTCNEDMNTLLSSVRYYYEPSPPFISSTEGTLWVEKEFDDNGEGEDLIHVVFTPKNSTEKYQVLALPTGTHWSGNFFVAKDNKVYFPITNYKIIDDIDGHFSTSIGFFDPISKESRIVSGSEYDGGYISSIYLHGDKLHYLLLDDPYCLDSYVSCEADLYEIGLEEGKSTLIAKDVEGSSIAGYAIEENVLYLSEAWGDAGACSQSLSRIRNGTQEEVASSSDCEESVTLGYRDKFVTTSATAIYVKDGRLIQGESLIGEDDPLFHFPK